MVGVCRLCHDELERHIKRLEMVFQRDLWQASLPEKRLFFLDVWFDFIGQPVPNPLPEKFLLYG